MSLPWNAVEPVCFSEEKAHRISKPDDAEADREGKDSLGALSLPSPELVQTWLKTNVKAFKGSERRRSLIHFELWIDPPSDIKKRILWVEYDLRSDAVQPRKKRSRNANAGFRAGFGSFACVSKIVMIVYYDDGRSQAIEVDGCEMISAKGPNQQGS